MIYYVNGQSKQSGNGSKELPFLSISEAAKAAKPGDEVLVYPGLYRENVVPKNAGEENARIVYKSIEPLGAEITGAEEVTGWKLYRDSVWTTRVPNKLFGEYNPYTTYVFGDWFFADRNKHTGCVWINDEALYEATSLEDCFNTEISVYSWNPEASRWKWYCEQDAETDETVFYVNFSTYNPNEENVEITVRRECFQPEENYINYITVSGFNINKAATTWAPPAAYQDCMIGPHWAKGWIIEDCEIWGSKCAGIGLGKYYDPDNENFFTYKHVKSATQMEREAVCRGQYHGWTRETVGSHIIRRNNIHHCEQGGIIGRMGGVFSIIEDNHIHHINNMMELGGCEIAGIKMHAPIDVIIRRNHIHHCTMGIWTDWEAQGTRISQNLLHDNQMPEGVKQLDGGMWSQDIFVEISHGPTLLDNNILLSDAALRIATQGVAVVNNLICGALTDVGGGSSWRYTPYHFPHRTEVMGFMSLLHGDDRFYNNVFVQIWPAEPFKIYSISVDKYFLENREAGTHVFDEYPTYDEWIERFDMDSEIPNMSKLAPAHFDHLPVWVEGNAYLNGAKPYKNEINAMVNNDMRVSVKLEEKDGKYYLHTNLGEAIKDMRCRMIDTDTLGRAFEPDEPYENPDATPIIFDVDCNGVKRDTESIPGPFAHIGEEIELKCFGKYPLRKTDL